MYHWYYEEHEDSLEDSLEDSFDKKVSSEVMYDWDYLDRMEERGEMSLEELMSLYKNLYTWEQNLATTKLNTNAGEYSVGFENIIL